jgi:hypothetical protein
MNPDPMLCKECKQENKMSYRCEHGFKDTERCYKCFPIDQDEYDNLESENAQLKEKLAIAVRALKWCVETMSDCETHGHNNHIGTLTVVAERLKILTELKEAK